MTRDSLIIQYASRGVYAPDCLKLVRRDVPALADGEVLIRPLLISIDPTSRNWLKLQPQSNVLGLHVGGVMKGLCVGEVVESKAERFKPGVKVTALAGWETLSAVPDSMVQALIPGVPLEAHLTVFSHIGLAAATGLMEIAKLQSDDIVIVSGAAGATGAIAVQMAVAHGARVIGIAGGAEKCRLVVEEFGAEAAIDYKTQDVEAEVRRLCPSGATLFFDNVGGEILDAVLLNLARHARIAVSGQIALYNSGDRKDGQGVRNLIELVFRRIRMEGFIAGEPAERVPEYIAELKRLYDAGKVTSRPQVIQGLENAPGAIQMLLDGANTGKLIIEVGHADHFQPGHGGPARSIDARVTR